MNKFPFIKMITEIRKIHNYLNISLEVENVIITSKADIFE